MNRYHSNNRNSGETIKHRASLFAVITPSILFVLKLTAGIITNSVSIVASALDSFMDILASGFNYFAIKIADTPADDLHQFGHSKAEALASFTQSILIGISGLYLIVEGIKRLFAKNTHEHIEAGIIIMILSMIITSALVLYMRHAANITKSLALKADSYHYITDIASNAIIIITLYTSHVKHWYFLDPVLCIALAFFILRTSYHILFNAADILMDKQIPEAERTAIKKILENHIHAEINGYHGFRTRRAGKTYFAEFHIECGDTMSLSQAHETGQKIETQIRQLFPNIEVMVHLDLNRDEDY